MAHFVARCDKYPQFMFNVPRLRKSFDKRGLGQSSTMLKFNNRVFDSKAADLTEEEAREALTALQAMRRTPPIFGTHIIVRAGKEAPNGN